MAHKSRYTELESIRFPALKKLLVITYYFPPSGGAGVQRVLKFVKYLPQYGWKPTVLTVTPTGYFAQDYSLLDELHRHHINIVRVGSLDPNRLFRKKGVVKMPSEHWRKILTFISDTFFIPDNKIGWKRKAKKVAFMLFEKTPFDVIFATAPPFTDFLIGQELSKHFGKPLVIDYRDSWHAYPFKYYPTPLHRVVNYNLEKSVLRSANRIITTNRRVKELLLRRYRFLSYDDVIILPQGYDPEDFNNCSPISTKNPDKMWITHAGVFYGDRTPKYFLKAIKKVFTDHPTLRNKIQINLIGVLQDSFRKIIKELDLVNEVIVTGYLEHSRCIQYLKSSDVLWFALKNDTQSPGKIYEYIGARKPILACVNNGFIKQTVEETEAAFVVDPENPDEIANSIVHLYELYQSKQLPRPNENVVQKYNRFELTRELSNIFGFLVE